MPGHLIAAAPPLVTRPTGWPQFPGPQQTIQVSGEIGQAGDVGGK
jgi:hypothetical protein